MKKQKQKVFELGAQAVLSREDLKNISGGLTGGRCRYRCVADQGDGTFFSWIVNSSWACNTPEDCPPRPCDTSYGQPVLGSIACS